MASSTVPPLAVSTNRVRAWFSGFDRTLKAIARIQFPQEITEDAAVDRLVAQHIYAAQFKLQDLSLTPYFYTRMVTEELASQKALVLGDDYDETLQPLDYDVKQWRNVSGRTEVPRMPIVQVNTMRLTLGAGGKIADIPNDWLNMDKRHGFIHLLPNAITSLTATFFTIFAIHPMLLRPGMGDLTPLLVHFDYVAGMCARTALDGVAAYDPDAPRKNTMWPQHEVDDYQEQIDKLASAPLLRRCAPALNRGGLSIGVDGLSRQVNTQVIESLAAQNEADAVAWAQRKKERATGPGWVFA